MTSDFVEILPAAITDNPFQAIGKDWMLITAGTPDAFNTMTASWGTWGELWNRRVAICFVRPQRFTFGFMESASHFTLSFFSGQHKAALDYCGSHSGRDGDKVNAAALTPYPCTEGTVAFREAHLVLVCRKLYAADLAPAAFVDASVRQEFYAANDFHRQYVGELTQVLLRRQAA